MLTGFEWDKAKATSNARKHRVTFEEAVTAFDDPMAITLDDPEHSEHERRFVTVGCSSHARLLVACHCDGSGRVRIISSRMANRRERSYYESMRKV